MSHILQKLSAEIDKQAAVLMKDVKKGSSGAGNNFPNKARIEGLPPRPKKNLLKVASEDDRFYNTGRLSTSGSITGFGLGALAGAATIPAIMALYGGKKNFAKRLFEEGRLIKKLPFNTKLRIYSNGLESPGAIIKNMKSKIPRAALMGAVIGSTAGSITGLTAGGAMDLMDKKASRERERQSNSGKGALIGGGLLGIGGAIQERSSRKKFEAGLKEMLEQGGVSGFKTMASAPGVKPYIHLDVTGKSAKDILSKFRKFRMLSRVLPAVSLGIGVGGLAGYFMPKIKKHD